MRLLFVGMKEKVLVTGGSGFIGSHIVSKLVKKGYHVIVVSNLTPNKFASDQKQITYYRIDLRNLDDIDRCLRIERPQVICHHAASLSYVKESLLYPQKMYQDFIMTTNLFEAARKYDVRQIILASSSSVYSGTLKPPITEQSHLQPLSPLGITKRMLELYSEYTAHTGNIVCTVFRYFNIFGPGQRITENAGIIPNLIKKGIHGEEVMIFGDGRQTRDFTYVEDIADANIRAINRRVSGVFNVGSGKGTSVRELVAITEKLLKKKIKVKYMPTSNEIYDSFASNEQITKVLGWKPKVPLKKGLKHTIKYYKDFYKWKN